MRLVIQRVSKAAVYVDDNEVGRIKKGLLVFIGVERYDNDTDLTWLINKLVNMRIFPDETSKMNNSIVDVNGSVLLVSQFKTVLNAAFTAYNIYGASLTPALLAAFLWKRATKEGAVISILTGSSITIIWTYLLPNWSGFKNLHPFLQELTYPAAGLSIFALVVVSLFTNPPPQKVLSQFFKDDDL